MNNFEEQVKNHNPGVRMALAQIFPLKQFLQINTDSDINMLLVTYSNPYTNTTMLDCEYSKQCVLAHWFVMCKFSNKRE